MVRTVPFTMCTVLLHFCPCLALLDIGYRNIIVGML